MIELGEKQDLSYAEIYNKANKLIEAKGPVLEYRYGFAIEKFCMALQTLQVCNPKQFKELLEG